MAELHSSPKVPRPTLRQPLAITEDGSLETPICKHRDLFPSPLFHTSNELAPNPEIFMCKLPPPVTVYVCMCVFSGEGVPRSCSPSAP